MTTETDKLVEMAKSGRAGAFYSAAARGWLTFRPDMLADFRAAIIADLAADVEQDGFRLVSVNVGFTELMEALDRADRKGYMPDAICNAYEGFEYRDPASTVAALKARVAVLEESASQFAGVDLDGMVEAFHRIIESQAQQSPFHNPVNADAALALRELRRLIPAMKAVALTKGQQ